MKLSKVDNVLYAAAFCCATILVSQSLSFSMPPEDPHGRFDAFNYLRKHAWLLAACGVGMTSLALLFIRLQRQILGLQRARGLD